MTGVEQRMQDHIDLTPEQEEEQEQREPSVTVELESGETEGVQALVGELEATADGFRVSDFKCPTCGLAHGHDTDKHRGSDSFGLTHSEASDMQFNPNCHCGYREIAHRGEEMGISDGPTPEEAANRAPVPSEVQRELRS